MEDIIISKDGYGFSVRQGVRNAKSLSFEEMSALISLLCISEEDKDGILSWMAEDQPQNKK